MANKDTVVNFYAKVIAEQARKERGISLNEATEGQAAKAYDSHAKLAKKGYNDLPLKHGDGFYHKHSEGHDQTYIIKHSSGKHSMTDIDHGRHKDKGDYERMSRMFNKHLSDDEHKEVAATIHKNYSD